jgi:N-acylglucosamine-6-phosphate 2-epimerase
MEYTIFMATCDAAEPGSGNGQRAIRRLVGGLVVSSQAHRAGGPMDNPELLVRMALAAGDGGARGYRVAGPQVVARLRAATDAPIIGLVKRRLPNYEVFITPSVADVEELVAAGADIVAVDPAPGSRPAEPFSELVAACHERGAAVMADCATAAQALRAVEQGADVVATTLAGYTPATAHVAPPDLGMLRELRGAVGVPVAVEGGLWSPEHVTAAFAAGAAFVVVGSAVTDPERITRRLANAIPDKSNALQEVTNGVYQ